MRRLKGEAGDGALLQFHLDGAARTGICMIARASRDRAQRCRMGQARSEKYPETEWMLSIHPKASQIPRWIRGGDLRSGHGCVAADRREACHHQSAVHRGKRDTECVCRPVEYFATISAGAMQLFCRCIHTTTEAARWRRRSLRSWPALTGRGDLARNGERTGNMDIVTMAMNLYSQGVDPELDLSNPDEIIQVVAACTNIHCSPRHPWVGELVYNRVLRQAIGCDPQMPAQQQPTSTGNGLPAHRPERHRPRLPGGDTLNSQSGKGGVAFVMERIMA